MEYIVIGPGAMGFYAMLGYLKKNEYKLRNVKEISGASAGAILALFLALGKSTDEILDIALNLNFSDYIKLNLKSFINSYGFVDIEPIREKFIDICECNPTFSDLDMKIYISAFCVNTSKTIYFSKDTHPEMKVIDAVCMSMAVPFIFSAITYDDMLYVDGGTKEILPTSPFLDKKPNKVLGIRLKMDTDYVKEIKSPRQFAEAMISSTLNSRSMDYTEKNTIVDIDIGDIDIFNFNMTNDEKLKLYMIGLES